MKKSDIQNTLFEMKDEKYKGFQCSLMPTVSPDSVIGVRTPILRRLAKEIFMQGSYREFLCDLPHTYYEENNVHAFIVEQITD